MFTHIFHYFAGQDQHKIILKESAISQTVRIIPAVILFDQFYFHPFKTQHSKTKRVPACVHAYMCVCVSALDGEGSWVFDSTAL